MMEPGVYFIECQETGRIKIGYAKDAARRLIEISVGCPSEVRLLAVQPGPPSLERELHRRFVDSRRRGEWFDPSEEMRAHISTLDPPEQKPTRKDEIMAFWRGMNTVEVADLTGISRGMISMIRTGRRRPSVDVALTIQRATGISAVRLVFGIDYDEAVAGLEVQSAEAA